MPWALQDGRCRHEGPCTHELPDASTVAVYAALQRYADFGGTEGAKVTDKTAAAVARVSRATFIRRREQLRLMGWIEWTGGQEAGKPNVYLIHLSLTDEAEGVAEGNTQGVSASNTPLSPTATPGVSVGHTASIDREPSTENQLPSPAKPAPDSWLAPFVAVHEAAFPGSVVPVGKMLKPFSALRSRGHEKHPEVGIDKIDAKIAENQGRYLASLKDRGGVDFLNYARFAETFPEWDKPRRNGRQAPPAPAYDTTGNDAALERLEREAAT